MCWCYPIQIDASEDYFLELINKIISVGMVDGLFSSKEQKEIHDACQEIVQANGQRSSKYI